jgi:hypothetical protein
MKRGGGWELSRQEPSDIDEAPKGERAGANQSNQREEESLVVQRNWAKYEAGAGIEPWNRFTVGEAILLRR